MARGEARDIQLAMRIADEVTFALGSAEDGRLAALEIVSVLPKRGGKHFDVTLRAVGGAGDARMLSELLGRAERYVRFEVGSALNLKRTPGLSLVLLSG